MIKDKTVGKLLNVDVKTLRNEFKIQEDESFAWVTMECGKEFAHGMFVSDLLFGKWFKEHAPSKELEETTIKLDELFTKVGLVSSKSDFRRILKNNALTADEEKAMQELEELLKPRIEAAERGEVVSTSVMAIFKETLAAAKP